MIIKNRLMTTRVKIFMKLKLDMPVVTITNKEKVVWSNLELTAE